MRSEQEFYFLKKIQDSLLEVALKIWHSDRQIKMKDRKSQKDFNPPRTVRHIERM